MKQWLLIITCYMFSVVDLYAQVDWISAPKPLLEALCDSLKPPNEDLIPIWNELAFRAFEDNDLAQAFNYSLRAVSLALELKDKTGQSDSWVVLGHVARVKGEFEQAEEYYLQALKIRRAKQNYWRIASCLNSLGVLCLDKESKYKQGIQYFQKALQVLKLSRSSSEKINRLQVYINGNIGDLFCRLGDYESAAIAFQTARSIATSQQLAELNINDAGCLISLKRYQLADEKLNEALPLFQMENDMNSIAKAYLQLSVSSFEQGHPIQALNFWQQADKLKTDLDATEQAILLKNRGSIAKVRGNNQEATLFYTQALSHFQELGSNIEIGKVHFDLGNIFYEQAKYTSAITHLETSSTILAPFSLPELKADLKLVLAAAYKNRKLNQWLLVIIGALLFVLTTASFLIHASKQKRKLIQLKAWKSEQRLTTALQELEIERNYLQLDDSDRLLNWVAKELHDRLGGMLSTIKLYFDGLDLKMDAVQEENKTNFEKANTLLDEVCEEVRRISRGALPVNLPNRGLIKEIQYLMDNIGDSKKIQVEFVTNEMNRPLNKTKERKLYRVINILVNNILVHAKATWFSLQINNFGENINIMVEDNGIGFNIEEIKGKEGVGIKNLYRLCAELGATISFDSEIGKGTTAAIEMPVLANTFESRHKGT